MAVGIVAEVAEGAVGARALVGIGLVAKNKIHIDNDVTRKLFLSVNIKFYIADN